MMLGFRTLEDRTRNAPPMAPNRSGTNDKQRLPPAGAPNRSGTNDKQRLPPAGAPNRSGTNDKQRLVAQIMGVKERRDRERLEMRQAILDSAREIAAKEGWQAVTIRRVAEKIEYSPPAIYEYFESKEALLEEEGREAFRIFMADLIAARDAQAGPRERLR